MLKSLAYAAIIGLMFVQTACSRDDGVMPVVTSPDSLFWSLRINYPAIRLSLLESFDTVTVRAVPYNVLGDELPIDSSEILNIKWISSDSSLVRVAQNGLISARGVTGTKKIYVTATRQIGNITKEDRALVQVTDDDNPPSLPASFHTRPADSLKRAVGMNFIMRPKILDGHGDSITGLPIHYKSSNTIAGRITDPWSGTIFAGNGLFSFSNSIGTSHITASMWAYGVGLTDTLTIEVGWPVDHPLYIPMPDYKTINGIVTLYLVYPRVDIGPGGVVSFTNSTAINGAKVVRFPGLQLSNGTPVSFIFDDSANVKSAGPGYTPTADGNIHNIISDTLLAPRNLRQFRKFNAPGEYKYTIEPLGLRGVVVVHDR